MPSPTATGRGRVVPLSKQDSYVELWMREQISIRVDIVRQVHAATTAAEAMMETPLPGRHRTPILDGGFAYVYVGVHPVQIPSDGQFHGVALRDTTAQGTVRYVAVPREEMRVYRLISFENPLDAPLLPGPVEVASGGRFLPRGEISLSPKGGEVTVWLGVEQGIKISRNTTFAEAAGGLLRGHIDLEHGVDVEVFNHLPHDADIGVTPKWEAYTQKHATMKGAYCWRFTLGSGKKQRLIAEYTVAIPAKHQLVGGNRREVGE